MARHRTAEEKAELKAQAATLRASGVGAKRIAARLGVGSALVHELLRDVPPPAALARPRAKDEHREAAVALRREGRTYDEIRAELGVSKGSLSLWLRAVPKGDEEAVAVADEPDDAPTSVQVARDLREDGWLLREIAAELHVSVKTVHQWTRAVPVPARATHGRSPEEVAGMRRASWDALLAEREAERQAVMAGAAAAVGALSPRELELIAVTAYVCEGAKSKPWRRQERLTFINNDPGLIRLFLSWLRQRGVPSDRLRLSLSIHETADVAGAERFWSDVIGMPVSTFSKATLKRHNPKTVRRNTGEDYRGCLVIGVRQSRSLYQHTMGVWQGIVLALRESCGPDAAD